MEPQSILGEHGEILIGDGFKAHAGEVVAHIDHSLANALLIGDTPPVYKFTSVLCRVVISSES